ncbi:MAG: DUF881 domain-containing protein [Propioniciclava sp.]|uniref:DUF881 domain-containing protein n=1 Tax=Propioniciclava sp. TaxID=2038686 RepID=UPI0039E5A86A
MPEPGDPTESVWRRIGRDLVRPTRAQLIVAVVLLVCGFGLSTQLAGSSDRRASTLRQDELVAMLDDVTEGSRRLESEIASLEATRDRLRSGADADAVARAEAARRLDALELLAGTVPAEGPGITVTISDPQRKVTTEIMLNTIEELRDAGAEVLEVDGRVRLVATSSVSSAGGSLTVDGVRLGGTFTITALGDPRTLSEATRFRGGLVATIEGERVGGTARVQESDRLRIDSVVTPRQPRYARPA